MSTGIVLVPHPKHTQIVLFYSKFAMVTLFSIIVGGSLQCFLWNCNANNLHRLQCPHSLGIIGQMKQLDDDVSPPAFVETLYLFDLYQCDL